MNRKRRPDLKDLEREILAAAEKARVDAQEIVDQLREDASAAAGRVKDEAVAAGERVKGEAPRKAVHLAAISIPIGLLYVPLAPGRRILMIIAAALLITDLAKIHQPRLQSYFSQFFGSIIRRHEHSDITGSTYLMISALLASYLFAPPIAAAALVFLIVGDTLAAFVGKAWGRTRIFGEKTLEGFLAGWISSFLAAWALVPALGPGPLAASAFVAMVVEILPIPVDDNFRIPLVAGLVLEWLA